jgi:hypothetical protein
MRKLVVWNNVEQKVARRLACKMLTLEKGFEILNISKQKAVIRKLFDQK